MSGRGALRRLRIGRRRGCRGDGWVRRGPRAGRGGGEDCPAVSAPAGPGLQRPGLRSWVARGGGPREPLGPVSPPPASARGAPPSAFVSAPGICGCQLPSVASPAGGAMGCGNSTATSAGAGQGERGGRLGARGPRLGGRGALCRADRLCGRGQERGGEKDGCGDPGQGGRAAPSPRPRFRGGSRPSGSGQPGNRAFPLPVRGRSRLDEENLQGDPAQGARGALPAGLPCSG